MEGGVEDRKGALKHHVGIEAGRAITTLPGATFSGSIAFKNVTCYRSIIIKVKKSIIESVKALVQRFRDLTCLIGGSTEVYIYIYD